MRKLISSLVVTLISAYVIYIIATGKIAVFIHPRYFTLTRWMAIIAVGFGIFGVIYFIGELSDSKKEKFDRGLISGLLAISLFAIFGFIYPVKPISSATLSQRSNEINFIQSRPRDLNSFSTNTKEYDISEWVYLFQSDPNWENFEGKEVVIEGFLYTDSDVPEGFFLISKFVISCCAVDARPVGLPVQQTWDDGYKLDQWLRIEGKLKLVQYGEIENLVIIPDTVTEIEIPSDPYIY